MRLLLKRCCLVALIKKSGAVCSLHAGPGARAAAETRTAARTAEMTSLLLLWATTGGSAVPTLLTLEADLLQLSLAVGEGTRGL